MDITEIRQKAAELKADTVHIKYESDGVTVKSAALFQNEKKVFAFPSNFSPSLFKDVDGSRFYRIEKREVSDKESWRNV